MGNEGRGAGCVDKKEKVSNLRVIEDGTYHNDDQLLSIAVQLLNILRKAFKVYWVVSEVLPPIHIINIGMLNILKEHTRSAA